MTDALLAPRVSARPRRPSGPVAHVTALLVTRGVTEFLPETLAALAAQTHAPTEVVVVDVEPDDDAPVRALVEPLWSAGPPDPVRVGVVRAPEARTFGAAARLGLSASDAARSEDPSGTGWVWLLHDDSAPEPDALAELLRAVELAPSVGVAGVKQRTWAGRPRVLEAGIATSRFGRRMTGIDDPELDQGQHDAREDVLAVGIAGALVRRDVWDELGGPDPALGPYGDGLDLCRRARLAGHRVVVVPRAVVRHAQASLARPWSGAVLNRPGWDARRSAQARREAYLHSQLAGVPVLLVPVVALLALASSPVRALGRLLTKEPHLVVAELLAPWAVLLRPGRLSRARRSAARTSRLPRRALRPLQVTWRDVVRQARDRRLAAAEARRRTQAPSELEQRELAALRSRRRAGLVVVLALAVVVLAVGLGPLVTRVVAGAELVAPGVLGGAQGVGDVWAAWLADRVPAGLGRPGPVDPVLVALLPFTALTGSVHGGIALLLLGAPVLAALGAWFAAGAATRSVTLRVWSALVWTAVPALLVGLGQGRVGAVLAHVALPWVALGVARGVGVARRDVVASGLVGAQRLPAARATEPAVLPDVDGAQEAGTAEDVDLPAVATAPEADPAPEASATPTTTRLTASHEASYAATAGAGLALALATAGAPVLLPVVLLALVAVAVVAPRRARLLWVAAPSLALHAPVVAEAVRLAGQPAADGGGAPGVVRLLLAEPGVPVATEQAAGWLHLLGWSTPPEWWDLGVPVPAWVLTVPLVVVALVALVRPTRHRMTRLGWVVTALGVLAAVVVARAAVGPAVVDDGALRAALGWSGPGVSLAVLGLLAAAVAGADGVREALTGRAFGWRQAIAGTLAVTAFVGPAALVGTWAWQVRPSSGAQVDRLAVSDVATVPAVGRQMQAQPGAPRVLALEVHGGTGRSEGGDVRATLLRGEPSFLERSRAVSARALVPEPGTDLLTALAHPGRTTPDEAGRALAEAAAWLASGTGDSAGLARLGIGAVLVPPTGDEAADHARSAVVAHLDATPGLERMTETGSGVIWRVVPGEAGTTAWARLVDADAGADGAPGATDVTALASDGAVVRDRIMAGRDSLVVLAERADPGWRAHLDGRPLRAVELGWQQAFEVPAGADGRLVVQHGSSARTAWFWVQATTLLMTTLLALPWRRRRGGAR